MKFSEVLVFVVLELALMVALMMWVTGHLATPLPDKSGAGGMRTTVSGDMVIWTTR